MRAKSHGTIRAHARIALKIETESRNQPDPPRVDLDLGRKFIRPSLSGDIRGYRAFSEAPVKPQRIS